MPVHMVFLREPLFLQLFRTSIFQSFPSFYTSLKSCHTSYPFDSEEVANLDVCTAALFSRCESNQQIMRPYGGERSLQSMQRSTEALI